MAAACDNSVWVKEEEVSKQIWNETLKSVAGTDVAKSPKFNAGGRS